MDRGTLSDLMEQVTSIPLDILVHVTHHLLLGLNYLHKNLHLIHRDIKPQNILINRFLKSYFTFFKFPKSEGRIKITDFGVSGEIANTAAFAKSFVGTLKYMSVSNF